MVLQYATDIVNASSVVIDIATDMLAFFTTEPMIYFTGAAFVGFGFKLFKGQFKMKK